MKRLTICILLLVSLLPFPAAAYKLHWKPVNRQADELVEQLDRAFAEGSDIDNIRQLLDNLAVVSAHSNDPLVRIRHEIFETRYSIYMSEPENALHNIVQAREHVKQYPGSHEEKYISMLESVLQIGSTYEQYKRLVTVASQFEEEHDSLMMAQTYHNLSFMLNNARYFHKALKYGLRAEEIYGRLHLEQARVRVSNNILISYVESNDTVHGRNLLSKMLRYPHLDSNKHFYCSVFLPNAYTLTGEERYLHEAYRIADSLQFGPGLLYTEMLLAHSDLDRGDVEQAARRAEKAKALLGKYYDEVRRMQYYNLMWKISEKQGDNREAYRYLKAYMELNDSIELQLNIDELGSFNNLEEVIKLETERETSHKKQSYIFWILVIVVVSVAIFGVLLFLRFRGKERLAQMNYKMESDRINKDLSIRLLMSIQTNTMLENLLAHFRRMESQGTMRGQDVRTVASQIEPLISSANEWEEFKEIFSKLNPDFFSQLIERYPQLTEGDLKLCAYIKTGMSLKQIAKMLNMLPDSVKKNRHRLRTRMGLTPDENLELILREM